MRDEVLGKWKHIQMRRITVRSLLIFLLWLYHGILYYLHTKFNNKVMSHIILETAKHKWDSPLKVDL